MARPLKAGVIGVGLAGGPHLEAIGRTGLAEAVAVAASSRESARRAADRWTAPDAHGEWRALVEDPTIDVVHNCTPNHLHAEVAHAVLAAGKHLITEKPLAMDVAEATALVAAASDSPAITALCHNYRGYAMVTEAHELIRAGAIGEVFHRGAVARTPGRADRAAPQVSRSTPRAGRAARPSARRRDRGSDADRAWVDMPRWPG
jgi:predicted dehydrogenase